MKIRTNNATTRLALLFSILLISVAASAQAQPTFSKVFTPSTIGPGSSSTATFTIDNTGGGTTVSGLAFIDNLPADVTIADPANASTDCDLGVTGTLYAPNGGSTVILNDAQVGAGEVCTVTVNVTSSTPGAHTNPAVTLSSSTGSSMSLPIDLTVVTSLPGFSKSFAPSSVPLGDKSTLTFTIDNTLNATGVAYLDFTDNLPFGMLIAEPSNAVTDCISPTFQDTTLIAVPGTGVITLDANGFFIPGFEVLPDDETCAVTVDVVATGAGMLENVTGNLLVSLAADSGKATDTLEVTVTPLAIQKSFTDDPVAPGGTVTLDFTITNFDRIYSATGIAFTDDLTTVLTDLTYVSLLSNDCGGSVTIVPTQIITFAGGTLAPEASCTISVSLAVPPGSPASYTNTTSTVTGTVDGSPVVGNMASDNLFVEPVPILTKEFLEVGTLDPDPIVNPGDDVILRFTVSNPSGTSPATDITFLDELTDGGPGTGFLPFPVSVTLPPVPDPPCGAGSSLALVFIDTGRHGLELTDGSLSAAPGPPETCTFDVTLTIPAHFPPGVYLNTTGSITATIDGGTRLGDPASDSLTVISAPTLSKAFTDDPVAPGGTATLEFTLAYPADASGDATDITFTDNLAPVLAGLTANLPPSPDPPCGAGSSFAGSAGDTLLTLMGGTLSPGETCTFTVTVDVPMGAAPGDYTNTTSSVGATVEGLPAISLPASDDLKVSGLVFSKEFLGDPVIAGDTVMLRFTISNIHPTDDATISFFTDTLDANLPGLAATGPPSVNDCGGALSGTTTLIYVGGGVLSGATCMIEVEVLVPAAAADDDYLNITSSLVTDLGVVDPATDILTVNSNLLQLTKAFTDDPVTPGDPVTLEFTLTNLDAANAATMISFTDDLGAALTGLTFASVLFDDCLPPGTVGGTTTDMITVTGVSLAAGGSCTLRVSLDVPGGAAANIYTNTTSDVTGDIGGLPVVGDPASDTLEIIQLLGFSKAFDGPAAATGTATLTFTITNPGTSTASAIEFSDDLSSVIPGLIATSLPAVPCGAGSSITGISFLTFSGGELPPMGGMCSFDVDVLVPATAGAGTFPNVTSELFQGGLTVAEPATADLTIEPPPTFSKTFAPDAIGAGGTSTLTFIIDNSLPAVAAASLAFTDNLPAGVVIATPSVTANTCGGSLTATAGATPITLTGGSVDAGGTCTIDVEVTGLAVGMHVNTTGDLTSTSGNSGTATDTLTVDPQPGFTKMFTPDTIGLSSISTLSFTIDNSASTVAATALAFTDNLPAAITIAAPPNTANTCGGTLTATAGSSVISLTGGAAGPGGGCTITVDVTSSTAGTHVNLTGDLTSSLGNSGTATATLNVLDGLLTITKTFVSAPVLPGGTVELEYTIANGKVGFTATDVAFTDDLGAVLAGLTATTTRGGDACGIGSVLGGGSVVSLVGGTVAPASSCTFSVDVLVPTDAADGTYPSSTSSVTADFSGVATVGSPAMADLMIDFLDIDKFFLDSASTSGTVTLEFTITNLDPANGATNIAFTDDLDAVLPGLEATGLPISDACGLGSSLTGTSIITLAGGNLGPVETCTFQVTVAIPASATPGIFTNITSALTADVGGQPVVGDPADVAVADLEVTNLLAIPTLGTWALLLLVGLLGLLATVRIRAL